MKKTKIEKEHAEMLKLLKDIKDVLQDSKSVLSVSVRLSIDKQLNKMK